MTDKPDNGSTSPTNKSYETTASPFFDQFRENTAHQNSEKNTTAEVNSIPSDNDVTIDSAEQTDSSASIVKGRLPPEAKRALVNLMRMGSIIATQKPKLFEQICRHEELIQAHLSDMYLRLLLDEKAGVALVLQQEIIGDGGEEDDIYTLITPRTLTLNDSLLLLVLRKYYQDREAAGEQRIIIDIEQIEAFLTPFLPLSNSSKSDRRKLSTSLSRMTERKILSSVRGEDSRFEITAVIRYVVSAEFLERLLAEYQKLAKAAANENVGTGNVE